MARVAIQILLYKSSGYLPTVLSSLQAQTFTDWELLCLENSEDDEEAARSRRILDESGTAYRLIGSTTNQGFAGGHNTLFALHQSEFVMLMNADAYLDPQYLDECVKQFDAVPNCASVTGLVYRWTCAPHCESAVSGHTIIDTAGLRYRCLASVEDRFAGCSRSEVEQQLHTAQPIFGVSGALAMYRRSAIESASPEHLLFDPGFFMYKEDVDLAIRLRRKGYSARYVPTATAFHERGMKKIARGILGRIRAERLRSAGLRESSYRNQLTLYAYHLSVLLGFRDLAFSFGHECLRALFICLSSPSVFIRSWRGFFQILPSALERRKALNRLGLADVRLDV